MHRRVDPLLLIFLIKESQVGSDFSDEFFLSLSPIGIGETAYSCYFPCLWFPKWLLLWCPKHRKSRERRNKIRGRIRNEILSLRCFFIFVQVLQSPRLLDSSCLYFFSAKIEKNMKFVKRRNFSALTISRRLDMTLEQSANDGWFCSLRKKKLAMEVSQHMLSDFDQNSVNGS